MTDKENILVDLDGTLATYNGWMGKNHIGDPIPLMVDRVKKWINEGKKVKIFTARVCEDVPPEELEDVHQYIQEWLIKHVGTMLEVTYKKDYSTVEIWDDRAIQVIKNTGVRVDGKE